MDSCLIVQGRRAVKRLASAPVFEGDYDVAVIGLGTAGAVAFRTAAQDGLKVIGIERLSGMGGLSTLGAVCFGGGITAQLDAYERCAEKGTVEYGAVLGALFMEGARIVGFEYFTNGVAHRVRARAVLDATGNATVAHLAGVRLRRGRAIDGAMGACARGETWLDNGKTAPRPIYANRPFDLTRSAREYSETVTWLAGWRHQTWKGLRRSARMLRPATMLGAREECRATTEEMVTLADAIAERAFPNPLFFACEPEDLPVFYGDHAFESEEIRNWKVHCGLPMFRFPSSVPYGTIVAKGVDNLWVPSKHFGVSHDLGGSLRMQPEMRKTGYAAACAAKIALAQGLKAKDVPYADLKPLLDKAGCLRRRPGCERTNVYHGRPFEPFSDDQVVAALRIDVTRTAEWWQGAAGKASGTPAECAAYAYWTAWKCRVGGTAEARQALADKLAAAMAREVRFAGNYAVALGLMKDPRARPVLREIVGHPGGARDPVIRNAYPNRIKALDLLRQFRDRASVPALQAIVRDAAKTFTAGLAEAQAFGGGEPVCRFQALSYAMMALRDMGADIPDVAFPVLRCELDGSDLADKLRMLKGGRRAPSEAGPGRVCGGLSPGQDM